MSRKFRDFILFVLFSLVSIAYPKSKAKDLPTKDRGPVPKPRTDGTSPSFAGGHLAPLSKGNEGHSSFSREGKTEKRGASSAGGYAFPHTPLPASLLEEREKSPTMPPPPFLLPTPSMNGSVSAPQILNAPGPLSVDLSQGNLVGTPSLVGTPLPSFNVHPSAPVVASPPVVPAALPLPAAPAATAAAPPVVAPPPTATAAPFVPAAAAPIVVVAPPPTAAAGAPSVPIPSPPQSNLPSAQSAQAVNQPATIGSLWGALWGTISSAGNFVASNVPTVLNRIGTAVSSAGNFAVSTVSTALNAASSAAGFVGSNVPTVLNGVGTAVSQGYSWVKNKIFASSTWRDGEVWIKESVSPNKEHTDDEIWEDARSRLSDEEDEDLDAEDLETPAEARTFKQNTDDETWEDARSHLSDEKDEEYFEAEEDEEYFNTEEDLSPHTPEAPQLELETNEADLIKVEKSEDSIEMPAKEAAIETRREEVKVHIPELRIKEHLDFPRFSVPERKSGNLKAQEDDSETKYVGILKRKADGSEKLIATNLTRLEAIEKVKELGKDPTQVCPRLLPPQDSVLNSQDLAFQEGAEAYSKTEKLPEYLPRTNSSFEMRYVGGEYDNEKGWSGASDEEMEENEGPGYNESPRKLLKEKLDLELDIVKRDQKRRWPSSLDEVKIASEEEESWTTAPPQKKQRLEELRDLELDRKPGQKRKWPSSSSSSSDEEFQGLPATKDAFDWQLDLTEYRKKFPLPKKASIKGSEEIEVAPEEEEGRTTSPLRKKQELRQKSENLIQELNTKEILLTPGNEEKAEKVHQKAFEDLQQLRQDYEDFIRDETDKDKKKQLQQQKKQVTESVERLQAKIEAKTREPSPRRPVKLVFPDEATPHLSSDSEEFVSEGEAEDTVLDTSVNKLGNALFHQGESQDLELSDEEKEEILKELIKDDPHALSKRFIEEYGEDSNSEETTEALEKIQGIEARLGKKLRQKKEQAQKEPPSPRLSRSRPSSFSKTPIDDEGI